MKLIYRMAGCEIFDQGFDFALYHGGSLVASFHTRNAAIRYIAKEFLTLKITAFDENFGK